MAIEEIRIRAVRGIRKELVFALDGASLALRGDNGTGKSSVVLAIMWGLLGEVPSESKGAKEYWHHGLESPAAPSVTIRLKGGGELSMTANGEALDEKGRALRLACLRSSPFLVRRQLIRILDDKPGDRFRYLDSFLDLEPADRIHKELVEAAEKLAHKRAAAAAARDRSLARCVALLPAARRAEASASSRAVVDALLAWARDLEVDTETGYAGLKSRLAELEGLLEGEKLARRRIALEEALSELGRRPAVHASIENDAARLRRLDGLKRGLLGADLSSVLDGVVQHLSTHPGETACPVCETHVDRARLLASLEARRASLAELRDLEAWLGRTATSLENRVAAQDRLVAFARSLNASVAPASPREALRGEALVRAVLDVGEERFFRDGDAEIADAEARTRRELEALPPAALAQDLRALLSAVAAFEEAHDDISRAEAEAERAAKLEKEMKAIVDAFRKARQDVARSLLAEISSLVTEFYTAIHPDDEPDEITGAPRIEVQRHGSGTAHVRGRFAKNEIDDLRWVYSEGHLDTVGICVFLALRRFRADRDKAADPKLMILDDIVLSVDLSHARRVLDLLQKTFADHQVLIFTHNGAFFEFCGTRLQSYKRWAIRGWTYETGPAIGGYQNDAEYLEEAIREAETPKLLAQALMNFADSWLKEARYQYAVAVKAKHNDQYTLTDLWEPFGKTVRGMAKSLGAPLGKAAEAMDRLKELTVVRNKLAAHDNDFAKEFPLSTVRDVARAWLELVDALYCRKCESFATPMPSEEKPERVRCRCELIFYDRPRKRSA